MGNETFESVVKKLANLDVEYLNLHREWRKEKALREQYERTLQPPENRAIMPVTEHKKGLCDECGYFRPLVNVKGHNVCELCIDLY